MSVVRIFDTAEEIPESYKGNKYVRTRRDEITGLMGYAVGCVFGYHSIDADGLVLADLVTRWPTAWQNARLSDGREPGVRISHALECAAGSQKGCGGSAAD